MDWITSTLGVMENVSYEPAGPVTLQSGDIVLIGTDGIWEARDPAGEMFGKDRLRQIIITQAQQSAAQIHTTVVQSVNQFIAAGPQEDDITLVVIKKL